MSRRSVQRAMWRGVYKSQRAGFKDITAVEVVFIILAIVFILYMLIVN